MAALSFSLSNGLYVSFFWGAEKAVEINFGF